MIWLQAIKIPPDGGLQEHGKQAVLLKVEKLQREFRMGGESCAYQHELFVPEGQERGGLGITSENFW